MLCRSPCIRHCLRITVSWSNRRISGLDLSINCQIERLLCNVSRAMLKVFILLLPAGIFAEKSSVGTMETCQEVEILDYSYSSH